MDLNKCQSKIPEDLKKTLGREYFSEFIEALENIPFVVNLLSSDRSFAKDQPKDDWGKIIVDIKNPHLLEDMDYFRQAAITFEALGQYTSILPNAHIGSEYVKFWKEEARRCRDGYIRESDGEWVTGLNYFYWNYSPILKVGDDETGLGVRIEGFPNPYDGDYLYYHYIENCRRAGKHGNVLKARGKGYSYKGGSGLAKYFKLGDRQTPKLPSGNSQFLL